MREYVSGGARCTICGDAARARKLCSRHYGKWRRTGDPTAPDRHDEQWALDPVRKRMFHNAKRRAHQKGLPFSLSAADIVIPEMCPVLGIRLTPGAGKFVDSSPSLDRVRSEGGYVPNNVRVISWRANRIKNNATVDELKKILRYAEND